MQPWSSMKTEITDVARLSSPSFCPFRKSTEDHLQMNTRTKDAVDWVLEIKPKYKATVGQIKHLKKTKNLPTP